MGRTWNLAKLRHEHPTSWWSLSRQQPQWWWRLWTCLLLVPPVRSEYYNKLEPTSPEQATLLKKHDRYLESRYHKLGQSEAFCFQNWVRYLTQAWHRHHLKEKFDFQNSTNQDCQWKSYGSSSDFQQFVIRDLGVLDWPRAIELRGEGGRYDGDLAFCHEVPQTPLME